MQSQTPIGDADPSSETPAPRIERRGDGQVFLVSGDEAVRVTVSRCFPWSRPTHHISLRDEDNNERLLIGDTAGLDEASRRALEDALAESGFVMCITAVERHDEEFEIRNWRVRTAQGPRTFQTKRSEWPREVPGGGLLIRDVAGDLYLVPDIETMDAKSQELLDAFID